MLGRALQPLPLKELCLRGNPLTRHNELASLCLTLPVSITRLDLSFQPLTTTMDLPAAFEGLARLHRLEWLDLSHMGLGANQHDADTLGLLVGRLQSLEYLSLRGNRIGAHRGDADRLASFLPASLTDLDLCDNRISSREVALLSRPQRTRRFRQQI